MPKTIKMKRADFKKWIAALRSGKYKQGYKALKDDTGGYCCLGVLQHCLVGDVERTTASNIPKLYPSKVWLRERGITFNNQALAGAPNVDDGHGGLIAVDVLNDLHTSFSKIADMLEKHVEYTD